MTSSIESSMKSPSPPRFPSAPLRVGGLALGTGAAILLAACFGSGTSEPETPACAAEDGFRVCTDRSIYAPGQSVSFSITNQGSGGGGPIFHDGCALEIVFRTDPTDAFPARYDHAGRCGNDPSAEEIRAGYREVPPGETVDDQTRLPPAAPQGEYRLNLWFVDGDGELLDPDPVHSGIFDVRPKGR